MPAQTTVSNGYSGDWQPVTGIRGSKTFTAEEGRSFQDIRAIYPRSGERRSSKFHPESGTAASPRDPFPAKFIELWQATFTCSSTDPCCDTAGAEVLRVLSRYAGYLMRSLTRGKKKSGRLRCSPSLSLWLGSRAQQRLQGHLYSWRSAACTSSNVLSLLRRKTDTP